MPSIRDESTVEALALEFCSNGRAQEQAMLAVGYSKAYANSYCGKLWDDPRLQAAIAKIDGEQAEIGHRTVAGIDKMYQAAHDVAIACNQPAAAISAITGIARLYGMDKDAAVKEDLPADITAEEADLFRSMAKAATNLRIA